MLDTRPDFRDTLTWIGTLIDHVTPDQLDAPTPCPDWSVRDLLGHLVAVVTRVGSIGEGGDPFDTPGMLEGVDDDEWPARFAQARAACEEVWADDAILSKPVRAPFATLPGAQILGSYIAELLVHGWDLATATGQPVEAPVDLAARTLAFTRPAVPADQRGGPMPFAAPVAPAEHAGPTEQLANWLGHSA